MEFILSLFKQNKSNKFCYIIGSFAITAPILRTPNSDVDIVCSNDMDEFEVRYYLNKKYPNLASNIKLDIQYIKPVDGKIIFGICYWQKSINKYSIELIRNNNFKLCPYINEIDLATIVRHPNKSKVKEYIESNNNIKITNNNHCHKSIKNHYGICDFKNTINNSNLNYQEKNIIKNLLIYPNDYSTNKLDRVSINKQKQIINVNNSTYTFYRFYRIKMKYNLIQSIYYAYF